MSIIAGIAKAVIPMAANIATDVTKKVAPMVVGAVTKGVTGGADVKGGAGGDLAKQFLSQLQGSGTENGGLNDIMQMLVPMITKLIGSVGGAK